MARVIDSSIFIALERRGLRPSAIPIPSFEDTAIAAVTVSELLVGVHRAHAPEQRSRRESVVDEILRAFRVLPFDVEAARVHARLVAEMLTTGQLVGSHDLLIAATALANGYGVLTLNMRDFAGVPGLVVQQPDW